MGAPVATYSWNHIVAWFDSSDSKVRIRINDSATYVSTATGALIQSATAFTLGARSHAVAAYFTGLDEVGFWKRKLSPAEMTALYNGGAGLPFSAFTI